MAAADALQAGGQDGMGGAGGDPTDPDQDGDNDATFFLPPDFLGGKKYKKGDTISLTVMGEDEDGDTEVCLAGKGGNDDWRDDLKQTMESANQNAGQGA